MRSRPCCMRSARATSSEPACVMLSAVMSLPVFYLRGGIDAPLRSASTPPLKPPVARRRQRAAARSLVGSPRRIVHVIRDGAPAPSPRVLAWAGPCHHLAPSRAPPPETPSVGHPIDHVIDSQLVGLVVQVDGIDVRVRPLPVFADVLVVVDDHHEALGGVVVLEYAEIGRGHAKVGMREGPRVLHPEERVEHR